MNFTRVALAFSIFVNLACIYMMNHNDSMVPQVMRSARACGAVDATLYLAMIQGGRTKDVVALYDLAEKMKTDTAWSDFIEGKGGYEQPIPPDSLRRTP